MNNDKPIAYTFLCPPGGASSVAPIITQYFLCPAGATHIRDLPYTKTHRVAPTGHIGSLRGVDCYRVVIPTGYFFCKSGDDTNRP